MKESNSLSHAAPLRSMLPTLLLAGATTLAAAEENQLPVSGVTATANDGNVPANTLDGSLATRWSAKGDGQCIIYDLGSAQNVSSVAIAWYQGNQRVAKFEIGTSPDASTWTPVFCGSSCGKTKNLETYDVADTSARYVVIVGHGNNLDLWNSITETHIFGAPPATPPPAATTNEVALPVAAVSASADDGDVPANTLDGNLATRWSAKGDGQWIMYDLGCSRTITSVDIAWYKGNLRAAKFDLQTSPNGSSWTT
jgi:poly(beta-D-mannuronate) lyase